MAVRYSRGVPAPSPRVIGIPGTFCAPSVFDPLASAMSEGEQPLSLLAMDWMNRPGPWTVPDVAAGVAEVVRELGGVPVLVVGHSTGGAVALQLALTDPNLVAGLVLVNTGPNMAAHGDVESIIAGVLGPDGDRVRAAVLDRSFAAPLPGAVRQALLDYADGVDPRAAVDVLRSQKALDLAPLLGSLRCPTAVVHGVRDTVRTVAQARDFAALIPGTLLTELDRGHSPSFEAPHELAAVVRRLLTV
jgi:pimeloyl-ACP methyl ester carboxylesterase